MTAPPPPDTIHATAVALDGRAVLLTGVSGSGKSDLALRLIDRGWMLVSDDRTVVRADAGGVMASPPPRIAGRMEVRGIGIVAVPHLAAARVVAVCELDRAPPRMPDPRTVSIAGQPVACVALDAAAPSAAIKLELLLGTLPT